MLNGVIFISSIINFNQAGEAKKKEQSIGWKKKNRTQNEEVNMAM